MSPMAADRRSASLPTATEHRKISVWCSLNFRSAKRSGRLPCCRGFLPGGIGEKPSGHPKEHPLARLKRAGQDAGQNLHRKGVENHVTGEQQSVSRLVQRARNQKGVDPESREDRAVCAATLRFAIRKVYLSKNQERVWLEQLIDLGRANPLC